MHLQDHDPGVVSIFGDIRLGCADLHQAKGAAGQMLDPFIDLFLLVSIDQELAEIDPSPTDIARAAKILRGLGRDLRHQLERVPETVLGSLMIPRHPLGVSDSAERAREPPTKTRVGGGVGRVGRRGP